MILEADEARVLDVRNPKTRALNATPLEFVARLKFHRKVFLFGPVDTCRHVGFNAPLRLLWQPQHDCQGELGSEECSAGI